jgi:hypothetical protein
MNKRCLTSVSLLTGLLAFANVSAAQGVYNVTVTSLLHGTPATMIPMYPANTFVGSACPDNKGGGVRQVGEMLGLWVLATHNPSFKLFTLGQPASPNLARLSQTGRPFFLAQELAGTNGVGQVFTIPPDPGFAVPQPTPFPPATGVAGIVLCPGESLTTQVFANPGDRYLSLAAMVFPTNDGFVALNGVALPTGKAVAEYYSPVYDSGSELNDELCGNIPSLIIAGFPFPGTTIGGAGKAAGAVCPDGTGADNDINSNTNDAQSPSNFPSHGEGYVHVHPGIRGIGDLDPRVWGWENSAMRVTIQRAE